MGVAVDSGLTALSNNYIPQIYAGKLLVKFYRSSVFGAIASTEYEGEIKKYGDKVIIRTTPDITIRDYTIGAGITSERLEPGKVELDIDNAKYFNFGMNIVEEKQMDVNAVEKWSADGAEQMKNAIDVSILANIYADVAAANKGATAGAISANINLGTTAADGSNAVAITKANVIDKIVECGQILDEQDVPDTGRWIVIPAWMATKLKTSDLKDASITGDGKSPLRNCRIGMIDRFEVFVSNNVAKTTETAVACFNVVFGVKQGLLLASQFTESRMVDDPKEFQKLIQGLQVYGYKVAKPDSLGLLYCKYGTEA
ncbi:MAG: hypothetical protein C0602_00105 [Denitrovibrio sp.]|nr:MAG: hypothetical protein C0602_00105 [Denitrovibrio sp.]